MRLIHTRSLEMEEFFGDQIPEYAILSHTWEKGEATFQDWTKLDNSIREKPGYVKITGACNQAKRDGFDWLWVDTNCIDKSSSAELTEAINSMFTWYRDARICYAYLQDVPSKDFSGQAEDVMAFFKKSKWFGRGWTLQELLAPTKVVFYTQEWKRIGSKAESLTSKIADITGIDEMFLDGSMALSASSISKRLSWIANRKTTRIEDMAYCLLGIFDINMPLLYGEGHKAFTRLQHEIIKSSSDHTIFCWTWNDDVPYDWVSMLAPFPSLFAESGEFVRKDGVAKLKPYSMTNIGLSIQLPVIYSSRYIYAILNVGKEFGEHYEYVGVPLRTVRSRNQFDRCSFPEKPVLLDRPTAGRHRHPTGLSGEHLMVRSAHDGPGQSPTALSLSRYNVVILLDPQCSFLHTRGKSLSSTSETDYFQLDTRDFGYGTPKSPSEAGDTIGLRKITEGDSPVFAAVVRIGNMKTQQHADILLVLRPGPKKAMFSRWFCQILPEPRHGHARSSTKTLKKSVAEVVDRCVTTGVTQTRDISEDGSWCVQLGGTVLVTDKAEVRVVRISDGHGFYDDEDFFGNETVSDSDAAVTSIARAVSKVNSMIG